MGTVPPTTDNLTRRFGEFSTFGENSPSTIRVTDLFSSGNVGYRFALVGTCSEYFGAQTGKLFSRLSVE